MHLHSDFLSGAAAFVEFLGRRIDQFVTTILSERDGIGLISGIFVFGTGLFVRYNYIDFPNLAGWEPEAYGILSFTAITTSFL
jgi:hypothetical protein